MNPSKNLPRLAIVLLAAATVLLAGCTGQPQAQNTGSPNNGNNNDDGSHVDIRNTRFEPQEIRVKVGDTVTWTNRDPYGHSVTADDAAQWGTEGSGSAPSAWLKKDQTWSHTFTAPGTYTYHCAPHSSQGSGGAWSGQTGKVIVE